MNIGSANSYLPTTSQSPSIADNSSLAVPTPVIANNQVQVNSATDLEVRPTTPTRTYGVGGEVSSANSFC